MRLKGSGSRAVSAALLTSLSACGGDQPVDGAVQIVSTASTAQSSISTAEAAPSPMTSAAVPSTSDLSTAAVERREQPFANFDFAHGSRYPDRAKVGVQSVAYPVGATSVNVPVVLDRPSPNTVIVTVLTKNGSGSNYGYEGYNFKRVSRTLIFRPGDPLIQTVKVPILRSKDGQNFKLVFPSTPIGALTGASTATVTAKIGAARPPSKTVGFRSQRQFAAVGKLKYDLVPAQMRWSDNGGAGIWSSKLSHGRSQPANAETGLYVDKSIFPGVEEPFRIDQGNLVIHSQKLAKAVSYQGSDWHYGAAILTGQRMPETQVKYGQYEWTARMPDRRGSWPALWFIGVDGWPPELDLYEGFGYASGWKFGSDISGTIHGGPKGQRNFAQGFTLDAKSVFGIEGLNTGFHRYAVDIQPDYITWFLDGVETYQAVNPFHDEAWYPLMNVAVKTDGAYTDGNGDMVVRSFRVWE